ncbi:MAG: NAD-dependent DNA ligase LigA [Vallitaleaceae bacterium]|nr:NAD-dependent DNA ligase LigA [Vallitaleaceae bacterium]
MDPYQRMRELIEILNRAARYYYHENEEIMSNYEYDELYNELENLEKELGFVLANSPTQKVGYELLGELPKEEHTSPMLSLDKTKSMETLSAWLGQEEGVLSYKLDGLTIVLTYQNGQLVKAVTRGNGVMGEVITNNAKTFQNVPLQIQEKNTLIVRGEAVIRYSDFEEINQNLNGEERYKNPRNLCSGSVRQLNNEITAKRKVRFYAFSLVEIEDTMSTSKRKLKSEDLDELKRLGFETVEYQLVHQQNLGELVEEFSKKSKTSDIGFDGLVVTFNNKELSKNLGVTAKFPRDSMAFKWQDENAQTTLQEIFWSPSRTGLINPVAVFEPVELEGTIVARASLHNLSNVEKLELAKGDQILVYKANMIIPQVSENLTRSGAEKAPLNCPICGVATEVILQNEVKSVYCVNPDCPAKKIKAFSHYVSRNAMNIEGLSEATLEKLIELGLLQRFQDLYHLKNETAYELITKTEGFGLKSYEKLIEAIETSRKAKLPNFIYALGIAQMGLSNAKLLCVHYQEQLDRILEAKEEELIEIDGFGEKIAQNIVSYFSKEDKKKEILDLVNELSFESRKQKVTSPFVQEKTFVITGSLELHENRETLKELIESQGGKVSASVSAKTDYLINNDVNSSSSKNQKAKSLGIPILSERDFIEKLNGL